MKKNDSGITLLVLVITIVVLTIIASIAVYEGKELIEKSKVQTLQTNMLTIQAKAKAYAEEIEAKIWTENDENQKSSKRDRLFREKKSFSYPVSISDTNVLSQISVDVKGENGDKYIAYEVTGNALVNMGLSDIQNERYIVIYNKDNLEKIDVMYKDGTKYNKKTLYTLSEIQKELSN